MWVRSATPEWTGLALRDVLAAAAIQEGALLEGTMGAVDGAGQMQPERREAIRNFAGYLSMAWHRISATVS